MLNQIYNFIFKRHLDSVFAILEFSPYQLRGFEAQPDLRHTCSSAHLVPEAMSSLESSRAIRNLKCQEGQEISLPE